MTTNRSFVDLLVIFLFCMSSLNLSQVTLAQEIDSGATAKKAEWITDAFTSILSGRYPRIKAISYWNEEWENGFPFPSSDLRINSSKASLDAYRAGVASDLFKTEVEWNITDGDYKLQAPSDGIYHAAYPDFTDSEDVVTGDSIDSFEDLAGKEIVYAYFSNNWFNGILFPEDAVQTIYAKGKIPFVRLMAWSSYRDEGADPIYTLEQIINGAFDEQLQEWARAYNRTQIPILAEFGTEVNGPWFPWNGYWSGKNETRGYGDPTLEDGPERFRDAYRHIIDIFRDLNVRNITWFYHVDDFFDDENSWNNMSAYYPGDDYIDWIGISVYGPLDYSYEWDKFSDLMDFAYPELCKISETKPLAILEWGADENGGTKTVVYLKIFAVPSIVGLAMISLIILFIVRISKRRKEVKEEKKT